MMQLQPQEQSQPPSSQPSQPRSSTLRLPWPIRPVTASTFPRGRRFPKLSTLATSRASPPYNFKTDCAGAQKIFYVGFVLSSIASVVFLVSFVYNSGRGRSGNAANAGRNQTSTGTMESSQRVSHIRHLGIFETLALLCSAFGLCLIAGVFLCGLCVTRRRKAMDEERLIAKPGGKQQRNRALKDDGLEDFEGDEAEEGHYDNYDEEDDGCAETMVSGELSAYSLSSAACAECSGAGAGEHAPASGDRQGLDETATPACDYCTCSARRGPQIPTVSCVQQGLVRDTEDGGQEQQLIAFF